MNRTVSQNPLPSLGANPWQSYPARIVAIRAETPGVRSYDLEFRDAGIADRYRFAPGQFNMLYLPGIGEAAISISSDPHLPRRLTHTVRAVGNVTDALVRCAVGDEVLLRGPYGGSWPLDDLAGGDVIIVAGGLGLASQRAAILTILRQRDRFRRVIVLHGAKEPAGLLYDAEYDSWRQGGIEVDCTVDVAAAGWTGPVGLVTDRLRLFEVGQFPAGVLCCGPDPMMEAVARVAGERTIPPQRVWVSLERNMSCAVGQCGLCQFGPYFVCLDGPVFRYDCVARYLAVSCL